MLTAVRALTLEAFYREFYPRLVRLVFAKTGAPAADVEDLVQDILLRAWNGRSSYEGSAAPETWITSIAHHRIVDWFRARGRSERHAGPAAREALRQLGAAPFPPDLLDSVEVRERVIEAMSRIDASYAKVLALRYVDGLSIRKIAERLGESEGAVESRLVRGRQALRERLGGSDV